MMLEVKGRRWKGLLPHALTSILIIFVLHYCLHMTRSGKVCNMSVDT